MSPYGTQETQASQRLLWSVQLREFRSELFMRTFKLHFIFTDSAKQSYDVPAQLAELVLEQAGVMATETSGNGTCSWGPGYKSG